MDTLIDGKLPSNWNYAVRRDGRVFFFNDDLQMTSWLHPVLKQPVQTGHFYNQSLPSGWEVDIADDGTPYFIDHNAFSTSWSQPAEKQDFKKESKRSISPFKRSNSRRKSLKQKTFHVKRNRNSEVTLRGWLYRQEGLGPLKAWKKRWCVLSDLCVFIYKGPEEGEPLESILLPSYRIFPGQKDLSNKKFAFKALHENMKSTYFAGESVEEAENWMEAMKLAAMAETGLSLETNNNDQEPSEPIKDLQMHHKYNESQLNLPALNQSNDFGLQSKNNKNKQTVGYDTDRDFINSSFGFNNLDAIVNHNLPDSQLYRNTQQIDLKTRSPSLDKNIANLNNSYDEDFTGFDGFNENRNVNEGKNVNEVQKVGNLKLQNKSDVFPQTTPKQVSNAPKNLVHHLERSPAHLPSDDFVNVNLVRVREWTEQQNKYRTERMNSKDFDDVDVHHKNFPDKIFKTDEMTSNHLDGEHPQDEFLKDATNHLGEPHPHYHHQWQQHNEQQHHHHHDPFRNINSPNKQQINKPSASMSVVSKNTQNSTRHGALNNDKVIKNECVQLKISDDSSQLGSVEHSRSFYSHQFSQTGSQNSERKIKNQDPMSVSSEINNTKTGFTSSVGSSNNSNILQVNKKIQPIQNNPPEYGIPSDSIASSKEFFEDLISKNNTCLQNASHLIKTLNQQAAFSPQLKEQVVQTLIHSRRSQGNLHERLYNLMSEGPAKTPDLDEQQKKEEILEEEIDKNSQIITQLERCLYRMTKNTKSREKNSSSEVSFENVSNNDNPSKAVIRSHSVGLQKDTNLTQPTEKEFDVKNESNTRNLQNSEIKRSTLKNEVPAFNSSLSQNPGQEAKSFNDPMTLPDLDIKSNLTESTFLETDLDSMRTYNTAMFSYGIASNDLIKSPSKSSSFQSQQMTSREIENIHEKINILSRNQISNPRNSNIPSRIIPKPRQDTYYNKEQSCGSPDKVNNSYAAKNSLPHSTQQKSSATVNEDFKPMEQVKRSVVPLKHHEGSPPSQFQREKQSTFIEGRPRTYSLSNDESQRRATDQEDNLLRNTKSSQNLHKDEDEAEVGFGGRSHIRRMSGIFTPKPFYKSRSNNEVNKEEDVQGKVLVNDDNRQHASKEYDGRNKLPNNFQNEPSAEKIVIKREKSDQLKKIVAAQSLTEFCKNELTTTSGGLKQRVEDERKRREQMLDLRFNLAQQVTSRAKQ